MYEICFSNSSFLRYERETCDKETYRWVLSVILRTAMVL